MGIIAQRLSHIGHLRQVTPPVFPAHLQRLCRLDRLLLTLGNNADKVFYHHQLDDAGNMGNRSFVHRQQAGADKLTAVVARIRRSHHPPV
ncbi:hypothetical protein D3C87_1717150 [compost metagenome]